MIKDFLHTDLKLLVDNKCAVIQHWIDSGQIAPTSPLNHQRAAASLKRGIVLRLSELLNKVDSILDTVQ